MKLDQSILARSTASILLLVCGALLGLVALPTAHSQPVVPASVPTGTATRVESTITNASTGAATNASRADTPQQRRRSSRPIVLGPDDKPAFDDPPAGFNVKRDGISHGKLEMIEYDSKTVGTRRKMQVY